MLGGDLQGLKGLKDESEEAAGEADEGGAAECSAVAGVQHVGQGHKAVVGRGGGGCHAEFGGSGRGEGSFSNSLLRLRKRGGVACGGGVTLKGGGAGHGGGGGRVCQVREQRKEPVKSK